ncbi:MAG: FtsQ-type POTRA domain-containing protein, partial [Chitinophagaceae bacterium]|nr:FtsQ-type POTRA domain-containing protein [Chitinophagaceae bacterium]
MGLDTKKLIRKILFITMWLVIGGGMLTLLIAAIGRQKRDQCKDYKIAIKGAQNNLFVDQKDVLKVLKTTAKGDIKGQKKTALNLQQMEQVLEKSVWVKDAELYFDNREVLHVSVTEREPVARIFTMTGKTFYIDEEQKRMPLSDKMSARVPVFTGFPEKVLGKKDSILLGDVKEMAVFILNDPFWMAQVAQIDITADRNFEMVPVVGNHMVVLGDGENIEKKFHRLFVFYKEVLSKTGFDKYKTVNVQYAGQIIGVKDNNNRRDTAQLRLNVEKMLKLARDMQNDSLIAARALKEQRAIQVDPDIAAVEKITPDENTIKEQTKSLSNPVPMTDPVPMKPL